MRLRRGRGARVVEVLASSGAARERRQRGECGYDFSNFSDAELMQ
jgi:hypothetical protein